MTSNCRLYEQEDLEHLQGLMLELGYSIKLKDLKNNIKEIRNKGGDVLVTEDSSGIVGSICVLIDARLAEGIYAEIVSLVVSERARGKGIGKSLVQQAELWARKRVKKIRVRANEIRESAHEFYEKQGYNHIKTQKIFIKTV